MSVCMKCGDDITPPERTKLANTCLKCGELDTKEARKGWTVVPYTTKGAYMLITNPEYLKNLNPKRSGY